MLTPNRAALEGGENDESDAVNILINTLQREGAAESSDTDVGTPGKVKNGKGRVSFEARKQPYSQTNHMQCKSIRTSLVIPNAPVNKDHQTLLGKCHLHLACAFLFGPCRVKHHTSYILHHVLAFSHYFHPVYGASVADTLAELSCAKSPVKSKSSVSDCSSPGGMKNWVGCIHNLCVELF